METLTCKRCNHEWYKRKPENPKTNLVVTGLYIYDKNVFNIIKTLKPSGRGELEVTDINNNYIKENKMKFKKVNGFWSDAGTFKSLHRVPLLTATSPEEFPAS